MKAGWIEKPISQCFKVKSGDFLPAKAMDIAGNIDVYGGNGITGKHNAKNLSGENIIIGRVGAYCGNVRHVTGDAWVTDNAFYISEYFTTFDYGYLATLLEYKQLRNTANQAAQPVVSYTTIKDVLLQYPPLPEQQRIVTILDEAFEGIATAKANAKKNQQNARALFESHLQAVFTQRGEGWVEKPISDLCQKITKGSSPKWQGVDYVDRPGILFVTSENVGEYRLLMDKPKYVEEKFNEKDKKSILQNGDVLTNIVGASIGRTAIFDLDEVANINQAVCLMRCEPTLLNNHYLTYLLNSPVFRQVLHDNEVDNARANLSLGFFSKLHVPLTSLQEQRIIVDKLDAFREETQRLESIYQQKLSALDALKKSLLDQAFTGQL